MRARQFPAIISCTTIDWFHEWPQEALVSVSETFLAGIEYLPVSDGSGSALTVLYTALTFPVDLQTHQSYLWYLLL